MIFVNTCPPLRPLAPLVDEFGRRGCFAQLSAVEDYSEAAEVVVSPEAVGVWAAERTHRTHCCVAMDWEACWPCVVCVGLVWYVWADGKEFC